MSLPEPAAVPDPSGRTERLPPALGRWTAVMLVVGATIGSGVFLKASTIAQNTQGAVGLILLLWTVCGVVNLCGALAMAELGAMMPHAGGTYVYLKAAYGRLWAFLWGWTELWVIRSGSIASLAVAMMQYPMQYLSNHLWGYTLSRVELALFAAGVIGVLTIINIIGVRWGGFVQSFTTVLKIAFVGGIAALPFVTPGHKLQPLEPWWPETVMTWDVLVGVGAAVTAIMWAYDGWGNVGVIAEEIREPQKSIPWALTMGVTLLIVLYVGANLAYHLTLPWQAIAQSYNPAVDVAAVYSPTLGAPLMNAVILISVFGALNANIIAGPRVLFAMARDGTFFSIFKTIQPQTKTPAVAVAALSIWSCVLIVLATFAPDVQAWLIRNGVLASPILREGKQLFDILTDYCVFGGSVFYFTAVAGVFVLRATQPNAERPYRTWGYPITPAIFVVSYVFFLIGMFYGSMAEALTGLGFIALGALAYPRRSSSPDPEAVPAVE